MDGDEEDPHANESSASRLTRYAIYAAIALIFIGLFMQLFLGLDLCADGVAAYDNMNDADPDFEDDPLHFVTGGESQVERTARMANERQEMAREHGNDFHRLMVRQSR